MNDKKLLVFNVVVSVASLTLLTVFAVKGLQAQAKLDTVQNSVKSVASKLPIIGSFFQR